MRRLIVYVASWAEYAPYVGAVWLARKSHPKVWLLRELETLPKSAGDLL